MMKLEFAGRQASSIRRAVSHGLLIHIAAHGLIEASRLNVEQRGLEARLSRHRVERVAQYRVQILDLLVGIDRVAQKVLTLSDLAAQLIAQRVYLLLEALDALTVILLAGLELSLRLHLRGPQSFDLELGLLSISCRQINQSKRINFNLFNFNGKVSEKGWGAAYRWACCCSTSPN